jgi:hypothetical protein
VALNSLAEERSEEAGNHLANIKEVRNHQIRAFDFQRYEQWYIQMDHIIPVWNANPPGWIFTIPGEQGLEHEEFVVRLQGVIAQKELPPITIKYVN